MLALCDLLFVATIAGAPSWLLAFAVASVIVSGVVMVARRAIARRPAPYRRRAAQKQKRSRQEQRALARAVQKRDRQEAQ